MLTASKFALFGVFMVPLFLLGACEKELCQKVAESEQSTLNQPLAAPLTNQSPSLSQPPNAPLMYQSPTFVPFNPALLATYTPEDLATALATESALLAALQAGGKFVAVRFGFDKAKTAGAGNFDDQGKDVEPADEFRREFTFEGNPGELDGVNIVYQHKKTEEKYFTPARSFATKGKYFIFIDRDNNEQIQSRRIQIDFGGKKIRLPSLHADGKVKDEDVSFYDWFYIIEAFERGVPDGKLYLLLSTPSGSTQTRRYIKLFAERG